jgi:hypothetical protein
LLSAYDQRNSAADEALFAAPWPRELSLTLRALRSSHSDSDQDLLETRRTKADARVFNKTPSEQIDGGNESASASSQIEAPASTSGVGDNAIEPGSLPAVNLDAARRIARRSARVQGLNPANQLLRQEPSAIERETRLGQAIARSSRSDCRSAYAGAGLFAIPLLIRDAVTDRGCKW